MNNVVQLSQQRLTVWCLAPATLQGVKVRTADTTVGNLDVNVVLALRQSVTFLLCVQLVLLTPLLRLKFTPLHVALDGLSVVAEPAFELVVGTRHFCDSFSVCVDCNWIV